MRALKTTTTTTKTPLPSGKSTTDVLLYSGGGAEEEATRTRRAQKQREILGWWMPMMRTKATTFTTFTTTQNTTHNVGWKMIKKRGSMQKHEALMEDVRLLAGRRSWIRFPPSRYLATCSCYGPCFRALALTQPRFSLL